MVDSSCQFDMRVDLMGTGVTYMFNGNEVITVVNLIHDRLTDTDRVTCVTLRGCSWFETDGTTGQDTKSNSRDIKVRIPDVSQYVKPADFNGMTGWSLRKGDKIILGEMTVTSATDFGNLRGPDIMTIREVHDNRDKPLPHLYVRGD